MCGIAGFQGRFVSELLGQMANAIAHRGPDGCGTFYRALRHRASMLLYQCARPIVCKM